MTSKLSLPRTSHFLDITLWTNGWMQWPTCHKSWRDWTSRIVSGERFKTAWELLIQPEQTRTFLQPRRWYSWLARKLLLCLVPAHSHVLPLTQMCGTYPVYSSSKGCATVSGRKSVEGRSHRRDRKGHHHAYSSHRCWSTKYAGCQWSCDATGKGIFSISQKGFQMSSAGSVSFFW